MSLPEATKANIHKLIYERAYEIESKLSEDNYFLAKLAGVKPEQVQEISLKTAIKELQKLLIN